MQLKKVFFIYLNKCNDLVIRPGLVNYFTSLLLFPLYLIIVPPAFHLIIPVLASFKAKILRVFKLLLNCRLIRKDYL